MFALSIATLAFSALSAVNGYVVPRKEAPATYATGYLEDYQVYHARYLALGCQFQHNNQTFFGACCRPMLATETLETARPSWCIPSASASASASAAEPTSTVTTPADGDDDCDDGDDSDNASSSSADDSDDDDQDCDDGEDDADSSSSVPSFSSTPTPSTSAFVTTSTKSIHSEAPSTSSPAHTTSPSAVHASSSSSTPPPAPSTSSSSAQAKPTGSSSSSSFGELITGGHGTFFLQNGVAGACGTVHSDQDLIVAVDSARYGNTGDRSPLCGKTVKITANGKTETAVVADACPTCDNGNSLDMSKGLFLKFAALSVGLLNIEWQMEN